MNGGLSVKLDFLNSIPSINAGNDIDDVDSDNQLHLLFPAMLEYLHLHS